MYRVGRYWVINLSAPDVPGAYLFNPSGDTAPLGKKPDDAMGAIGISRIMLTKPVVVLSG